MSCNYNRPHRARAELFFANATRSAVVFSTWHVVLACDRYRRRPAHLLHTLYQWNQRHGGLGGPRHTGARSRTDRLYHANEYANHPPFMSEAGAVILRISTATYVPFRIVFRTVFALFDGASALLLFLLRPKNRWRFFTTACYWLSPVTILISSYHGNTDTAIAFFVLLTIWLATKNRTAGSGATLGASLWVKLPGILALPSLFILFRGWRLRLLFLSTAFVIAAVTYAPALIQDYKIIFTNVFGYRGLILQTANGVPLWGPSVLLFSTIAPIESWPQNYLRPVLFVLERSWYIAIAAMILLAWLRRNQTSAQEVCATIGMSYAILFGFSDYWAFQYFAWALPFWFFLRSSLFNSSGISDQRISLFTALVFLGESGPARKMGFSRPSRSTDVDPPRSQFGRLVFPCQHMLFLD
jgi:hypothetical protein